MKFTYRAAGPVAAAALLTLLCGCSRTQRDWRAAQQAGTRQAYGNFIARHPDSELAAIARERLTQLTEQAAWRQATRANTAAAYRQYLATYPNGSWSQDARIRMESRSLPLQGPPGAAPATPAAQPATVQPATVQPATVQPATVQPATVQPTAAQSVAAQPAVGRRAAPEGFAVQLGAYSTVANARTAWAQLSSKFASELQGLTPRVVPIVASGRKLYRLEAPVANQPAARGLCRQLQQHSQGCLPLP